MKEIYILNKGDNINKASYEYSLNSDLQIKINNEFDIRYVDLENGNDDVCIVKNYLPYYEYIVKKDDTIMSILSKGYKIENTHDIEEGDVIIINKPRSIRYVTKPLEKLEDIAKKFGVSENYIMEVNNLVTKKLFVGEILWI